MCCDSQKLGELSSNEKTWFNSNLVKLIFGPGTELK